MTGAELDGPRCTVGNTLNGVDRVTVTGCAVVGYNGVWLRRTVSETPHASAVVSVEAMCVGRPRRPMAGYWCPRSDIHAPHLFVLDPGSAQARDSAAGKMRQ